MNPKSRRKNKRSSEIAAPRSAFSKALREANEKVRAKDYASGLGILNTLAVGEVDPGRLGKILILTAESQFRLGRYMEAAEIYSKSKEQLRTPPHPSWFSAAYGEISSLLKAVQTLQAYTKALEAVKLIGGDHISLQKLENATEEELSQSEGVLVGPRPARPTTILTRLGNLFLHEGYPDTADEFFRNAIGLAPNGASRARQGLARIALSNNEFESAERYARESLQMGRFQAKTIHSWTLYHEARQRRGNRAHDPELFDSLVRNGSKSVTERAITVIVGSLRKWSDPAWKQIASQWASKKDKEFDPILSIELSKMLLAEAKITESDAAIVAASAAALLKQRLISSKEVVALVKTFALYSLRSNADKKPLQRVLGDIKTRFSPEATSRAIHSAALGAMLAERHDLGRSLLQDQVKRLDRRTTQWRTDVWALARMETVLGNHESSARWYLMVAEHLDTPARFQLQGLLHWLEEIKKSGKEPDISKTKAKLENVLYRMTDCRMLLDAARQLTLAGDPFKSVKDVVAAAAVKTARDSFEKAKEPGEALQILIHLTRRQYHDLFLGEGIHEYWDSLPTAKREWLWTQDAKFWEYLSLVLQSYDDADMTLETDKLAHALLQEATTPAQGMAQIATTFGEILVRRGEVKKGILYFEKAIPASPLNRLTAKAYYWRALAARNRGDKPGVLDNARMIRRCFGSKPALYWELALDSRACLLTGEVGKANQVAENRYAEDYLTIQADALEVDASLLR